MAAHWPEYLAELLGVAILVFFGTSAIIINFGSFSIVSGTIPRLFLTGLMFSTTGALVAVSPLGKLSGAHINPAVSLSFWLLKMMHHKDLVGFLIFQFAGAAIGSSLARLVWGEEFFMVNGGVTLVGSGLSVLEAFAAEIFMTFVLVISILIMLSHERTAKFTPLIVILVVTLAVVFGAQVSGTSLNPARSFGPALATNLWTNQWIYFAAPITGAILASIAYHAKVFGKMKLKTAKLFHHDSYRCIYSECRLSHDEEESWRK